MFGNFAALAEFERELISERTVAGLASARARGTNGGRPVKTTAPKRDAFVGDIKAFFKNLRF